MTRPTRAAILATGALLGALTLAACGNDDSGDMDGTNPVTDQSAGAESESSVNDADIMFAQMMIPHHEQAIEMSDIVLANDGAMPEVADLAQEIKDAQGPEIDTLTGWLTEWGADPAGGHGMDHGGMGPDAIALAEDIVATQEEEIATMGSILGTLGDMGS